MRRIFVGVVALLALVLAAAPASAHATLEATTPANGAELPAGQPPKTVSLKFSQNVQIPDNAIRVVAAGRGAVDIGEPRHGTSDSVVTVGLPVLPNGTYVVSWRIVSADSHIVSGALSFSVGPAQGVLSTSLPSGPGPNRLLGFVFGLDRVAAYFGVLVLIGSVLFRRAMWPADLANRAVDRLTGVAWTLAFVSALAGLGLEGVASAGAGLGSLFDASHLSTVLSTDFGHALVARAVLLVASLPVLLLLPRRRLRVVDAVAVIAGLGLAATFIYAGHAHTGRWVGLAMITDELHVSAASVWFGGLCALVVTFAGAKVEDSRFALSRYVLVAAPAISLVVLSGSVQGLRQVGTFSALFDTTYGRLLLVKVATVIAILIAANASRRVTSNRLLVDEATPPVNRNARRKALSADRSALSALRKAVAVEVAFAIVVLAVTAVLTNTEPARSVTSGTVWGGAPFSAVLPAAPLSLAVAVTPGHTGTNRVTLTPRAASGSSAAVKVVDVDGSISQPDAGIAKLEITFARQRDGSYEGKLEIPLPGIWQLDLSVLRNQFDESRATADLPIGVARIGTSKPTPTTSGLSPTGVAQIIKPYRDKLLAGLEQDRQICPGAPSATACRKLLDDLDATAVSLSRTLRASSPQFSIESTMYFTVDSADEFASGVRSYFATGCGEPKSTVSESTCLRNTQLYRDPASEFERNLRGWDQYL